MSCRDRSRHVASCRDSIELRQLHDLRDVARDRLRRHQIFVADCRRYFSGVEVTADAITLQTSYCSWVPGSSIAFCHLFERQGEVRVVVCRALSRHVATWRDKSILIVHAPSVPGASGAADAIHSPQGIRREHMNTRLRCYPCATHAGNRSGRDHHKSLILWWAHKDLNLGPAD